MIRGTAGRREEGHHHTERVESKSPEVTEGFGKVSGTAGKGVWSLLCRGGIRQVRVKVRPGHRDAVVPPCCTEVGELRRPFPEEWACNGPPVDVLGFYGRRGCIN